MKIIHTIFGYTLNLMTGHVIVKLIVPMPTQQLVTQRLADILNGENIIVDNQSDNYIKATGQPPKYKINSRCLQNE